MSDTPLPDECPHCREMPHTFEVSSCAYVPTADCYEHMEATINGLVLDLSPADKQRLYEAGLRHEALPDDLAETMRRAIDRALEKAAATGLRRIDIPDLPEPDQVQPG
jgi:hypothetical protein